MIEAHVRAFILATPGAGDAVTTGRDVRIFPVKLPPGAKSPAIVYQRISGVRDRATDGPTGLGFARIQIDIWGEALTVSYDQVKAIADAIRVSADGYTGLMGSAVVQDCQVENDRDDWDEERKAWGVGFDLAIDFDERTAG